MRQVGMALGFVCALTSILTPVKAAAPPSTEPTIPIPYYPRNSKPAPPTDPMDKEARKHLPKEAEDWRFLGAFPLTSGDWRRLLILYCEDTSYVYQRTGLLLYPNFFTIHAVYRDFDGKWVRKTVIGRARVSFVRVKAHSSTSVDLQLRPGVMVMAQPNESIKQMQERAKQINQPFVVSLALDFDGNPVALMKADTMASGPKTATGGR